MLGSRGNYVFQVASCSGSVKYDLEAQQLSIHITTMGVVTRGAP